MRGERSKSSRLKCLLPAEIIMSEGKPCFTEKETNPDSSSKRLKLITNLDLDPSSFMDIRVYFPGRKISNSLLTEVAWSSLDNNKLKVALEIMHMDTIAQDEILKWILQRKKE